MEAPPDDMTPDLADWYVAARGYGVAPESVELDPSELPPGAVYEILVDGEWVDSKGKIPKGVHMRLAIDTHWLGRMNRPHRRAQLKREKQARKATAIMKQAIALARVA